MGLIIIIMQNIHSITFIQDGPRMDAHFETQIHSKNINIERVPKIMTDYMHIFFDIVFKCLLLSKMK